MDPTGGFDSGELFLSMVVGCGCITGYVMVRILRYYSTLKIVVSNVRSLFLAGCCHLNVDIHGIVVVVVMLCRVSMSVILSQVSRLRGWNLPAAVNMA
jgi:hypothetical protein